MHDVNVLDILVPESGAFYIMDRGCVDFRHLYSWPHRRCVLHHPKMDQATYAHQVILWHIGERGEESSVDLSDPVSMGAVLYRSLSFLMQFVIQIP